MSALFEKQLVVVTGASRGIGRAIAQKFASEGADLLLIARQEPLLLQLQEELLALQKGTVHIACCDLADYNGVQALFETKLAELGRVDVLINCAGITRDCLLLKMGEGEWDAVMDANAKSCFNTSKAVIRSMLRNRRGAIINISSVVGIVGNPGQANYAASKGAVLGFTKALAKEVASKNIRVNAILPGYIESDMTRGFTEQLRERLVEEIPLRRFGQPEEVAEMCSFLASSKASYITGQWIRIDGGIAM